jgi:hypothetical protein
MLVQLKHLLESRLRSLSLLPKLEEEGRIQLLRKEITRCYEISPVVEISFVNARIMQVGIKDFSYSHDLQMRKYDLIRSLCEAYPKKPITDIRFFVK